MSHREDATREPHAGWVEDHEWADTSYGSRWSKRCTCGAHRAGTRDVQWWNLRRQRQERKRVAAIEAFKESIFNADLTPTSRSAGGSWWSE